MDAEKQEKLEKQAADKRARATQQKHDAQLKKESVKKLADLIKQLVALKAKVESACTGANDVMNYVVSGSQHWAWANSENALKPLRAALESVRAHKSKNDFWHMFTQTSADDFKDKCQPFAVEVVAAEVEHALEDKEGSFQKDVRNLERQVRAMVAMSERFKAIVL